MLLGIAMGFGVGLMMGLTGAGGGVLAVPALMSGMGLSLAAAGPVALIAVGLSATFGAVQGFLRKLVRYRAAVLLAVMGAVFVPLGRVIAAGMSEPALNSLFAVVMLISAYRMFLKWRERVDENISLTDAFIAVSADTGRLVWTPRAVAVMSLVGATAGLFTGLLGVGGGFVIVPALASLTRLSMQSIVATSLTVIMFNSSVAIALAAAGGGLSLTIPLWLFVGVTLVGMMTGRIASGYIPVRWVNAVFILLCIAVAGVMLARVLPLLP